MSLHIYNKNEDMNANGGFNNCINDSMALIVISEIYQKLSNHNRPIHTLGGQKHTDHYRHIYFLYNHILKII